MKKLSFAEFCDTLRALFSVTEPLTDDTDLALYIRDSIDLGELIAVLKEKHGVVPQNLQLFKTHSRLDEVLKIFNHELA